MVAELYRFRMCLMELSGRFSMAKLRMLSGREALFRRRLMLSRASSSVILISSSGLAATGLFAAYISSFMCRFGSIALMNWFLRWISAEYYYLVLGWDPFLVEHTWEFSNIIFFCVFN